MNKEIDIDGLSTEELEQYLSKILKKLRNEQKTTNNLVGVGKIAEITGLHENTIYRHARAGKIKSIKVGRTILFDPADFKTYFRSIFSNSTPTYICTESCLFEDYMINDIVLFEKNKIYILHKMKDEKVFIYNQNYYHIICFSEYRFKQIFRKATDLEIDTYLYNL